MKYFFLLLAFLPLSLLGQTVSVKGYVVDTNDEPVLNARVKISDANSVFTNRDGEFTARLSLRTNLNRRVRVNIQRTGFESYSDNSLVITDNNTKIIGKITLYRIGEQQNDEGQTIVTENTDLITDNQDNIDVNQEILNQLPGLPLQYQTQIRDIETRIEELKPKVESLKATVADLEDNMNAARDKNKFLQSLLETEKSIITQQERIFGLQDEIIESISEQATKLNLSVDNANVKYIDKSTVDIAFTFEDALGNRLEESNMQVIGIKILQLTGGNNTKALTIRPEGSDLSTQLLKQNVDLSRETKIRFRSPNAFKRKNRKKGFIVEFYLDDALLGARGYRL